MAAAATTSSASSQSTATSTKPAQQPQLTTAASATKAPLPPIRILRANSSDPIVHTRTPKALNSTPKQQQQQAAEGVQFHTFQTPAPDKAKIAMPTLTDSPKVQGSTSERLSIRSSVRSSFGSASTSANDDSYSPEKLRRSSSRGKIMRYSNGASKEEIDGGTITRFANGDVRRVLAGGKRMRLAHSPPPRLLPAL